MSAKVVRYGRSRILRIGGTLAQSRHVVGDPGLPLREPDSAWGALAALAHVGYPSLPRQRQHVLHLGVGLGTVARAMRWLEGKGDNAPFAQFTGVDHHDVLRLSNLYANVEAIGWYDLHGNGFADFCRHARRGAYDVVVEDMFVGGSRKPAVARIAPAFVTRPGCLVSNALDGAAKWRGHLVASPLLRSVVEVRHDLLDNRFFAAFPGDADAADLRARMRAEPALSAVLRHLRFRTIKLEGRPT